MNVANAIGGLALMVLCHIYRYWFFIRLRLSRTGVDMIGESCWDKTHVQNSPTGICDVCLHGVTTIGISQKECYNFLMQIVIQLKKYKMLVIFAISINEHVERLNDVYNIQKYIIDK